MIQPVILCGDSRVLRLPGVGDEPIIVCDEGHLFMIDAQLRRAGARAKGILLEPVGRGTAPALTLAAVHALSDDDPVLLAMPSDHLSVPPEAFQRAVQRGAALAAGPHIVVFGVPPTAPEPRYGCIRADGDYVDAFVEKTDAPTARQYLESGQYLWSAGIFAVRASVWIDALGALRPDILKACERAWREGRRDGAFLRVAERPFRECPSGSIEYAVMERIGQGAGAPEARVMRLADDMRFEDSYDRTAPAANEADGPNEAPAAATR